MGKLGLQVGLDVSDGSTTGSTFTLEFRQEPEIRIEIGMSMTIEVAIA